MKRSTVDEPFTRKRLTKQDAPDIQGRLAAALDEETPEFPQAWMPEPGDTIYGQFTRWTTGITRRDEKHPVAIIDTADGPCAVWLFYRVLLEELQSLNPQPGEHIAIRRYPDRAKKGDGGGYRFYKAVVEREGKAATHTAELPSGSDWTLAEPGGDERDRETLPLNWKDAGTEAAIKQLAKPFLDGGF